MNTPLKISSYVLGLVVVFAAATGIGSLVGPIGDEPAAVTEVPHTGGTDHGDMQPGTDHPADD
ncbi:hypothetical protein [Modestobacter lacusdianchii]